MALEQNYPNPFNPATEIRFQLSETEHVLLIVYNTIGQEVKQLVNDMKPAASHSVIWDGKDAYGNGVASGIYIYRLQARRQVVAKRMIFVK